MSDAISRGRGRSPGSRRGPRSRTRGGLGVEVVVVSRTVNPVRADSRLQVRSANSGCALIPVPTAVPPSGTTGARPARHERVGAPLGPGQRSRGTPARDGSACVLEVGPAGLDHRPEGLFAGDQRGVEGSSAGQQLFLDGERRPTAGGRSGSRRSSSWQRLTSSFGWAGPGVETSLRQMGDPSFMLVLVEVPTRSGRYRSGTGSSWSPSATEAAAAAMGVGHVGLEQAELRVVWRASLMSASARRNPRAAAWPEIGKLRPRAGSEARRARRPAPPPRPSESRSIRVAFAVLGSCRDCRSPRPSLRDRARSSG